MSQLELLRSLRCRSTWGLLGLSIITYGIYYAHYCAKQSRIINRVLERNRQIPVSFTNYFLILSYVSLAFLLGHLLENSNETLALFSKVADWVWTVNLIFWGFYARNRMNEILGVKNNDSRWFHGFWTFIFTPLYFNYKVNVLNEQFELG